jgi:1,4-dihydroxy-2-naphthoate polyprenyltransferase
MTTDVQSAGQDRPAPTPQPVPDSIENIPLLKRWQISLATCNCPDVLEADFFSRWLVITRACVFSMTFTSGFIGVLLALEAGVFKGNLLESIFISILCIVGLLFAHASNNLINDWTDVQKGVDTEDYPRAQYSTHPILGGLTTPNRVLLGAGLLTLLDGLIMLYLASIRGNEIIAFAVAGLVLSIGYTGFLKRFAMGELTALVVWGPLMIGGTYFALAGNINSDIWLLTVPYGLVVASVLVGKHIDKIENDKPVGVNSIPVILGESNALWLNKISFIVFYALVIGLVVSGIGSVWLLLTFLALRHLQQTWKAYSEPKPTEKPDDWHVWPLWYVAWAMYFNRRAGSFFILGLMVNLVLPLSL